MGEPLRCPGSPLKASGVMGQKNFRFWILENGIEQFYSNRINPKLREHGHMNRSKIVDLLKDELKDVITESANSVKRQYPGK